MTSFVAWNKYWDHKETVIVDGRGYFNVYTTDCAESEYFIICVHGAGHSALSFSLLAHHLKGKFPVCALDLKCHGDTPGEITTDLEITSLVEDVAQFCRVVLPEGKRLILIGHSLGGSVAARVALKIGMSALIVIDTIEESSLENLDTMQEMLIERPDSFIDEMEAIDYISNGGEMSNFTSAAASAPGRIIEREDGVLVWKTDLLDCIPSWRGWFEGYADAFIESDPYKILILPEFNRLDTKFAVANLNGKFQTEVFFDAGHCVHEDKPKEIAQIILKLVKRLAMTDMWMERNA